MCRPQKLFIAFVIGIQISLEANETQKALKSMMIATKRFIPILQHMIYHFENAFILKNGVRYCWINTARKTMTSVLGAFTILMRAGILGEEILAELLML